MQPGYYPLDQPLPADVVVGGLSRWFSYRRFPVFGSAWLTGRARLFGLVFGLLGAASGLGNGYAHGSVWVGLRGGTLVCASFMLIAFTGPLLAGWVRRQHWCEAAERRCVVLAVLFGMFAAFGIDQWASAQLAADVQQTAAARPAPPPVAPGTLNVQVERGPGVSWLNLSALALIYLTLGGGLALRGYFGERRRWAESQLQQAMSKARQAQRDSELQLRILQAQVEPHFLFNSLAAVRSILRSNPQRAEETLDALVDFLRASIPDLRTPERSDRATLGAQIDLCTHFLTVMQLRMGERLRVHVELSASLRALPFPALILLTLVENAIKHGLEPAPAGGTVRISASRGADWLEIEVRDTGVGLAELPGSGVGLANVRAQLQARYGERAALAITAAEGGGVSARVRVPLAETNA